MVLLEFGVLIGVALRRAGHPARIAEAHLVGTHLSEPPDKRGESRGMVKYEAQHIGGIHGAPQLCFLFTWRV
jgi:hypothetical protein